MSPALRLAVFTCFAPLALLSIGCVSTNRTALAPAGREKLKEVQVTSMISQPEIGADINPSNVSAITGGGLIGALVDVAVDANRSKKAEAIITPLRDALVDFDVAESLRSALAAEMIPESPLATKTVVSEVLLKPTALAAKAATCPGDAVLFISVDYRLSPDFSRLRVLAHASLHTRETGSDKKAVYANDFATYRDLGSYGKREANLAQWAENHGERTREALKASFAELASMIEYDVAQGEEANLRARAQLTTEAPSVGRMAAMQNIRMRGDPVQKKDQRIWVRLATGELSSTY